MTNTLTFQLSIFCRLLTFILAIFFYSPFILFSQEQNDFGVNFRSGVQFFPENFSSLLNENTTLERDEIDGHFYKYVQFYNIPNQEDQERLRSFGIEILEYLPNKAYLVSFPLEFDISALSDMKVRSLVDIPTESKLDQRLTEQSFPEWALEGEKIKVIIKTYDNIRPETFMPAVQSLDITYYEEHLHFPTVHALITQDDISRLLSKTFVAYLEMGPPPDIPEDTGGRTLQRSNLINSPAPGGLHYDADGVSIMVRDDGSIGPHIDFEGRVVDFAGAGGGTHGDGVAGVFAGAGNLDPTVAGSASAATIYVLNYQSLFTDNTIALHQSDNVVITNSSYSNGCNAGYTTTTQRVDQQMIDHPTLIHVFSAGNSGSSDCGYGAGSGWGNITGGHKQGKNVMATANLFADESLVVSSSRGPAYDGRIKPDIAAHGQGEISTNPNNTYTVFGGTSSAAPTMAGSMAQLYEVYRDLHGGTDPEAALIKATVLNTAYDLGNRGPDFKYGWGRIDAYKAYHVLADDTHTTGTISQGGINMHSITIPTGVAEVRAMLYWTDPAAAVNASTALVNDLDFTITDPSSSVHLPWTLDPTPNPVTLDLPATKGVDILNNMEQVSIDNPSNGIYTLTVDGKSVPMGPQSYHIVWCFLVDDVMVTYPNGGEGFVPGETERIHWNAYGNTGTFDIDYSLDNGANWVSIVAGVAADLRNTTFMVPSQVTEKALVRVTRGAQSDISDVNFTIIGLPVFTITDLCTGGVSLSWPPVTGADEYIVYQLGAEKMDPIGQTTNTNYDVFGLMTGNTYWFSIQAINSSGAVGRRADAKSHTSNGSGVCPIDDLGLVEIITPMDLGRTCSPSQFGTDETITVKIENFGNTDLGSIVLNYQINGGPIVSENYIGTIVSGHNVNYVFNTKADLSGSLTHDITAWIEQAQDELMSNNSLSIAVKAFAFANPIIYLPFTQDFESAENEIYNTSILGLSGIESVDFETDLPGIGRLRTNAGPGFHLSGNRAITMDVSAGGANAINYAILTINLQEYSSSTDLTLGFSFMHHGEEIHSNDRVWIRGDQSNPWLEIFDWSVNLPDAGEYTTISDLDISALLSAAGQSPGCLFQVRFGQEDNFSATSTLMTDGLTIDDVIIKDSCVPLNLNSVNDARYCTGDMAPGFIFSTTPIDDYLVLDWTSTIDVGFGTSGNGNIGAFTATNIGSAPLSATISVTLSNPCGGIGNTSFMVTVDPQSVGGTVDGSATVCAGINTTGLTLSGHIGNVEKWQADDNPGFTSPTDIINTTTALTATNLTATTYYRAVVKSGTCTSTYSSTATVTVDPESTGGAVDGSATVCAGTNSTDLLLSGHTGDIEKWQSDDNPGFTSPTDITNTTTDLTATDLTTTTYYRAVVKSGTCTSTYSSTATVIVDPESVGGTVNGSTSVCIGTNSTDLSLSGHTGVVEKWQADDNPGFTSPTDISNTTTDLTATNLAASTYYRAVVKSGTCTSTYSSTATVIVDPESIGGAVDGSATVCAGTNSTDLLLSGHTGDIEKWQSDDNPGFTSPTDITNTTTDLTATDLTTTTYYRAVVKSGTCTSTYSSTATVIVDPESVGGTVNGSTSVCIGTNSTDLSLSSHTGNIEKWQSDDNPDFTSPTDITNTTTGLTATDLTTTTYFRAVVKSGTCPSAYSTTAMVTVDPESVGGTIDGPNSVCTGSNTADLTLIGHTGDVEKWQSDDNPGFTSPSDISNTTTALTATDLTATTYYRAVVKSGVCSSTYSSTAMITVDPPSIGGTVDGSATVCEGTNTTDLTLSGHTGNIEKWQADDKPGFTSPTDITNTTTSLTATDLTVTTYYRAVVKSGVCSSTYSSTAMVTVENITGTPDNITGPVTICPLLENLSYSIDPVPGAAAYSWSFSDGSASIEGSGTSIFIDLDETFSGGILSVTALGSCATLVPRELSLNMASPEFCSLASCLRESLFVDDELLAVLNSGDVYKVAEEIGSDAMIPANRSIVFKAGESLGFYPPFTVPFGAEFSGEIEACLNTIIGSQEGTKK